MTTATAAADVLTPWHGEEHNAYGMTPAELDAEIRAIRDAVEHRRVEPVRGSTGRAWDYILHRLSDLDSAWRLNHPGFIGRPNIADLRYRVACLADTAHTREMNQARRRDYARQRKTNLAHAEAAAHAPRWTPPKMAPARLNTNPPAGSDGIMTDNPHLIAAIDRATPN